MGFFDIFKKIVGNANSISAVAKLLNGKVDVKSLGTILSTFLMQNGASSLSKSQANAEGASLASQIASAVNLSSCSGVNDIISKLQQSDKPKTDDLASKLAQAVQVINQIAKK